jgi:hypothetical protein
LENEVIISEIVFGMVHGCPYKGFPKKLNPPYTSSHYSSLELFIKMLKFLKNEKLSSKNKMLGRKNGESL